MKVRLLCDVSDEVRSYLGNELVEVPSDKAERWIKAGLAVAANGTPVEAATLADADERATLPPARKRG